VTGPIHDRSRFLVEDGLLPSPIRLYPPTFTPAQAELLERIRQRDRRLAATAARRRLNQTELDRADLLYLLGSLLGRIERERWTVDLPTDSAPTRTPQLNSPST
jgi:hypothetical protein